MLKRKIQSKIIDYLENGSNKILVLNGARQIGKSYIIRHEGQQRFENYIEIDLIEDKKGDRVFEGTRNKEDFHLPQEVLVSNKELTSSLQAGFCRGQQEVSKRWQTAVQRS